MLDRIADIRDRFVRAVTAAPADCARRNALGPLPGPFEEPHAAQFGELQVRRDGRHGRDPGNLVHRAEREVGGIRVLRLKTVPGVITRTTLSTDVPDLIGCRICAAAAQNEEGGQQRRQPAGAGQGCRHAGAPDVAGHGDECVDHAWVELRPGVRPDLG